MKICLVCCPVSTVVYPPPAIACLGSYLKFRGHDPTLLDINMPFDRASSRLLKSVFSLASISYSIYPPRGKRMSGPRTALNRIILSRIAPDDILVNRWAGTIVRNGCKAVGFSINNGNLLTSLRIAKRIKIIDNGIKIIFGGPPFSSKSFSKQVISGGCVDYIVMGDGEEALAGILDSLEQTDFSLNKKPDTLGPFTERCLSAPVLELNSLPAPDYLQFDLTKYGTKIVNIFSSRGCPRGCAFCNVNEISGVAYRFKSGEAIFREIKELFLHCGCRNFNFLENAINGNPKELENLCRYIISEKLDIRWGGSVSVTKTLDLSLLKTMFEAGCRYLFFGIESGSQKVLKSMDKIQTTQEMERSIRDAYNSGISVGISIIVGFPTETWKDFISTLGFIQRNRKFIQTVNINICSVLPGTKIDIDKSRFGIYRFFTPQIWWSDTLGPMEKVKRAIISDSLIRKFGIKSNLVTFNFIIRK